MQIQSASPPCSHGRRWARAVRFCASRIPLTLGLASLLYYLGRFEWILPYAGDGHYTEELTLKGWVVLMHSVLTTIIHKTIYTFFEPFGWRAWNAIAFSSALAGGMAIQVLYAIRRRPLFLLTNIAAGSFLVFVGEVECYAWVNLFLLLTFLAVERFLNRQWSFWPAALFFFLAALCHMLALFYLPALFWIMRRDSRINPWEFLGPFLGFIAFYLLFLLLLPREGLDLDISRLTPLFQINRKGQLFTFFSLAHWELLAYFHWKSSFFQCLPTEIPLLILLRKWIHSPFQIYLLFCSLLGLCWTLVWHPDLGRLDWDLFSQAFIPIHVLLGIIFCDIFPLHRKCESH